MIRIFGKFARRAYADCEIPASLRSIKRRLRSISPKLLLWFIVINPGMAACYGDYADPAHSPQITGASFVGSDRAWLTTFVDGGILRTEDGAKTWVKAGIERVRIDQVAFIDEQRGWAVSGEGKIWRTVNAGRTWTGIGGIESSTEAHYVIAHQMYFADETHGWIVDAFSVWCTADGGVTWNRCFSQQSSEGAQGWPQRYFYISARVGLIAASNGEFYRTRDAGQTWQRKRISGGTDLTAVYFVDEKTGWLAGSPGGGIYHTSDGGDTWQLQLAETRTNNVAVDSVHFINKQEGWAVGRLWPVDISHDEMRGLVLQTWDGGQTWKEVEVGENELFYVQVHFTDSGHGWVTSRDNVYRTEDGGKSWSKVLSLPPIKKAS